MDRGLLFALPGSMRSRRLQPLVLIGLLATGLGGCVTPSIPIPPPSPSEMSFAVTLDTSGQITSASLSYPAKAHYEDGIVYVYNRTLGVGIIQNVNADGSIGPTTPVEARLGNALVISIENDDQTVSTCVLLREGTPSSVCQ
jgi:hypothetical protein